LVKVGNKQKATPAEVAFLSHLNRLKVAFAYYFVIYEDPAAVLAYYDFLPRLDIELPLRRDLVKAASAGITLNRHNCQPVPCV
jgi:hypothetical protein